MRLSVAILVAAALVACKKPEAPAKAAPQMQPPGAAQPAGQAMQGKVLEKLEAPPYTYLKLQTESGEAWTAVPATKVEVGAKVAVLNAFPMQEFESKTLNRKFPLVYFGTLEGEGQAAPMGGGMGGAMGGGMPAAPGGKPDPAQMAAQHKMVASGPDVAVEKLPKATSADARTVSEVWSQQGALKAKSVSIRAKVVKYSPGIMGKNWVHLRDGSGSAEKNDNDLTVTTQDETKVGDVVTVKGIVQVDKDFGAGYSYPVIVEDAKLVK
jgi:hypothetical protein